VLTPRGHDLLELLERAVDQDLRGAVGPPEGAGDLTVVHVEGEAHDQRLPAVVGQLVDALEDMAQLLAALRQRFGGVNVRDDPGVLDRGLRPARAVAVEVGGQVVGDADEPRAQRAAVGLAQGALEVPVGLEEGLLREVLGVVVVADPVVGVGVDVAEVGPVEVRELRVELLLAGHGMEA
jgi:hypothetical protein